METSGRRTVEGRNARGTQEGQGSRFSFELVRRLGVAGIKRGASRTATAIPAPRCHRRPDGPRPRRGHSRRRRWAGRRLERWSQRSRRRGLAELGCARLASLCPDPARAARPASTRKGPRRVIPALSGPRNKDNV